MTPELAIPASNLKRIVIIGAGFAGLELVKKINTKLFQVVLLDKNNYHTFQPLLYQVATAGLETESIAEPVRNLFRKKKNFHFRMAEVTKVEEASKTVFTYKGQISYDYLVLGQGTKTNFFGCNPCFNYRFCVC